MTYCYLFQAVHEIAADVEGTCRGGNDLQCVVDAY